MRPKYRQKFSNYGVVICEPPRNWLYNQNMVPKTIVHIYQREDWDGNAQAVPGV